MMLNILRSSILTTAEVVTEFNTQVKNWYVFMLPSSPTMSAPNVCYNTFPCLQTRRSPPSSWSGRRATRRRRSPTCPTSPTTTARTSPRRRSQVLTVLARRSWQTWSTRRHGTRGLPAEAEPGPRDCKVSVSAVRTTWQGWDLEGVCSLTHPSAFAGKKVTQGRHLKRTVR